MNRQGRLFACSVTSLIVSALISGCGKDRPGWKSLPVAIYSDASLVDTNEKANDFAEARAFWEARAGRKLFDYRGEWRGGTPFTGTSANPEEIRANVVFLQNPWPFPPNAIGMTTLKTSDHQQIQAAMIMVNPSTALCSGDCRGDSRSSLRKMLTHELGHFVGLDHSTDRTNVMFPDLLPGASLDALAIDGEALRRLTEGTED